MVGAVERGRGAYRNIAPATMARRPAAASAANWPPVVANRLDVDCPGALVVVVATDDEP